MPPAETPDPIGATIARALARFRPPLRLPLSQWIETKMRLPDGLVAKGGKVALWPFQRGIADAMTDPGFQRVTVLKCVRVGYSTLLVGLIGNHVENEPAPVAVVLPTDKDCRDFIVSDLEPIFEATPAVAGALTPEEEAPTRGRRQRRKKSRNTMNHRQFPGGSLKIIPGRSPRNMRKHTIRVLLIDEEDGFEVTKEGDPIDLAIKRTLSFPNRKIIRGSTPADLDTSTICREYDASDQRVFEIRCVHCDERSEPQWDDITWDKTIDPDGRVVAHHPDTAQWACPKCGALVDERFKAEMVANGEWRATRPEVKGHAGFRLNALISPHVNARWSALVAEYLQVCKDPERLKTFVNTLLGRGWAESISAADPRALEARAEAFGLDVEHEGVRLGIPSAVLVITVGVDVQGDRLEVAVWGFDRAGTPYALGHHVIFGSPADDETWRQLDALLLTRWPHPNGGTIGVDATAIDSGDGNFVDEVYAFCWARARRRVMAIKGMRGKRPSMEMAKGKVRRGKLDAKGRLWIVGTDTIKVALLQRLARKDTGGVRFSKTLPPVWFEQLTSERPVTRTIGGRPVRKFERIGALAAEALDCTVYAFAARRTVAHINLDEREVALAGGPMQEDRRPRTPREQAAAIRTAAAAPDRPRSPREQARAQREPVSTPPAAPVAVPAAPVANALPGGWAALLKKVT